MTQQLPSRPPSGGTVSYQVTDQVPATEADAQGRPVRGVRVHYRTAGGAVGSVFIEDARFAPENVRAAIQARVGVHDQVGRLES